MKLCGDIREIATINYISKASHMASMTSIIKNMCGDIREIMPLIKYNKLCYNQLQRKSYWNHICADVLPNLKFDNSSDMKKCK